MMCKIGDIILINNYNDSGICISKHSFVVISDVAGQIQGLDYDLICNVMSSFKNEEQRLKKLTYPGNFPITHNDSVVTNGNTKDGFIKAEQIYYFSKEKIDFITIGSMKEEVFKMLIDFINELDIEIQHVIDNL
jgi:hypothetical protein